MLDFLKSHPKLLKAVNVLLAICGLLLIAQKDLPNILQFLPANSNWPKYLGFVFALAAFVIAEGKKVGLIPEDSAPKGVVPASEAITEVVKSNPKKSI